MRIAISGYSGCGNTTVTTLLEKKYGFKRINFTFRDLGKEKGKTLEEMQALASKGPEIDYELDSRLISRLSKQKNAVIGSRLAIWLDSKQVTGKLGLNARQIAKIDFKVWLDAPIEVRAARTQQAKPNETMEFTARRDKEDRERYKKIYGIDVAKHDFVDLNLNVEKLDAERVAATIAAAAAQFAKSKKT